jgi:hypothetical protein
MSNVASSSYLVNKRLSCARPTKFELVINLRTAKQVGLTISQSALYRADR